MLRCFVIFLTLLLYAFIYFTLAALQIVTNSIGQLPRGETIFNRSEILKKLQSQITLPIYSDFNRSISGQTKLFFKPSVGRVNNGEKLTGGLT